MSLWAAGVPLVLVVTNLVLLGLSRMGACIRVVAAQGILLGLVPIVEPRGAPFHAALLALGTILLKGILFPRLLFRAVREAEVRREVEPYVGYGTSILAGTLLLLVSLRLGARLAPPGTAPASLAVPVALFTALTGLFLIVSRKKAVSQVLGYIVLENGIYAFGVARVREHPVLVELGVLLDVFVAVFVMGIAIFRIQRQFDHMDTDRLAALRDAE